MGVSQSAVGWECLSVLWEGCVSVLWEGCVSVCCGKGVSECAVGWACLSVLWDGRVSVCCGVSVSERSGLSSLSLPVPASAWPAVTFASSVTSVST